MRDLWYCNSTGVLSVLRYFLYLVLIVHTTELLLALRFSVSIDTRPSTALPYVLSHIKDKSPIYKRNKIFNCIIVVTHMNTNLISWSKFHYFQCLVSCVLTSGQGDPLVWAIIIGQKQNLACFLIANLSLILIYNHY